MKSSTPGCDNLLCDIPILGERQRWRNHHAIQPGNIYCIKMSVYAPLFTQAGVTLDECQSLYAGGKGPRPCVIMQKQQGNYADGESYLVCLMATFGGFKAFDSLDKHFKDRSLPVYCRHVKEPAIQRGDTHIHTTPDWDCDEVPQFILPIYVTCRREQLGDWPVPRSQKQNKGTVLHGPTRAPSYYLDSLDNGAFRMLRDKIYALESSFYEEYGEDEARRQQWIDELHVLRQRAPHSLYTPTVYSGRSAATKRTNKTSHTKLSNMTSCTDATSHTKSNFPPSIASVLMNITGMALDESGSEKPEYMEPAPPPTPSGRKPLQRSPLQKSEPKGRLSLRNMTSFRMAFRPRYPAQG
ncbi:hypothetical protein WG66_014792 [Moniliophthora roreri]|nr:hypothetical protein WG66_014792 [Moniliophthora roreri]